MNFVTKMENENNSDSTEMQGAENYRLTYAGMLNSETQYVSTTEMNRGARPKTSHHTKPDISRLKQVLFFKNRDAVGYIEQGEWEEKSLQNEEVYVELCKVTRQEYIEGIQKIGGYGDSI